eukprot:gene53311-65115_t
MNLQQLGEAALAGRIEGLDVVSLEGGFYILQARLASGLEGVLDEQGKVLRLRSTTQLRDLLQGPAGTAAPAPGAGLAMVNGNARRLGLVLGDQLSFDLSLFAALDPARDAVLMAEVNEEASYVPHHPHKIVLVFSAMRHFAAALEQRGWRVIYTRLD